MTGTWRELVNPLGVLMPVAPSLAKSIREVRPAMSNSAEGKDPHSLELSQTIFSFRAKAEKIHSDSENLAATLELAREIAAFRGKGCQIAARDFAEILSFLTNKLVSRNLPTPNGDKNESTPVEPRDDSLPEGERAMLEMLAAYAFERLRGPRARSFHAGALRAKAWRMLFCVARFPQIRLHPDCLHLARKVVAETRATGCEQQAAMDFEDKCWQIHGEIDKPRDSPWAIAKSRKEPRL
jgi:hypothetical protein